MATDNNTGSDDVKSIIIGIDNKNGTFTYETNQFINDDPTNKIKPDAVDKNPYTTLQQNITNNQFVHIKVERNNTEPALINQSRPTFKLNNQWYTLILDKKSDIDKFVDNTWFDLNYDMYSISDDIYNMFKLIDEKDIIIANIKFFLDPKHDYLSNFKQQDQFKLLRGIRKDNQDEYKKQLEHLFFAIKTFYFMKNQNQIDEQFKNKFNRFGFPNIYGDASHFISALQMLFDINKYCSDCIKTGDGKFTDGKNENATIEAIKNIIDRRYFYLKIHQGETLTDEDYTEKYNYKIFEDEYIKECRNKFTSQDDKIKIESFFEDKLNGSAFKIITDVTENFITPLTTQFIILKGEYVKIKDYKHISQIIKLDKLDHFIYVNKLYNYFIDDTYLSKNIDNQLIETGEICFNLYKKNDPEIISVVSETYKLQYGDIKNFLPRSFDVVLYKKYDGSSKSDENIVETIITQYIITKSFNTFTENKKEENTVKSAKNDDLRFGLCNFTGNLSYFTAAMQIMFCILKDTSMFGSFTTNYTDDKNAKYDKYLYRNINHVITEIFSIISTGYSEYGNYKTYKTATKAAGTNTPDSIINYFADVNFIETYADYFDVMFKVQDKTLINDDIKNSVFYKLVLAYNTEIKTEIAEFTTEIKDATNLETEPQKRLEAYKTMISVREKIFKETYNLDKFTALLNTFYNFLIPDHRAKIHYSNGSDDTQTFKDGHDALLKIQTDNYTTERDFNTKAKTGPKFIIDINLSSTSDGFFKETKKIENVEYNLKGFVAKSIGHDKYYSYFQKHKTDDSFIQLNDCEIINLSDDTKYMKYAVLKKTLENKSMYVSCMLFQIGDDKFVNTGASTLESFFTLFI
jgi:hypothetical protein